MKRPFDLASPASLVLATLAGLSACQTAPTDAARERTLPVAAQFPHAGAGEADAAPLAWPRYFTDARTRRLIELALANNRDLQAAAFNLQAAQARAQVQASALWPTIGAGATVNRQPSGGKTVTTYSGGLVMASYELDLFGRLRNLDQAAQAQVLASQAARHTVQAGLVAAVASTALALQADDELLDLARRTLATREDTLRLATLRLQVGAGAEPDVQAARSLVEATRAALAQAQRQRELDENALVLLLGQPLPADLAAGPALSATPLAAPLPVGLPSQVLLRRPDIWQAEQALAAAQANVGAARAAFFPQITLTSSAGTASTELSGLFKGGSWVWTFTGQVLQPLWDAGRNQGNFRAAQATRDAAQAQYEKAVQSGFREVADALAGRATLDEQWRAQQAQAEAEAKRLQLTELRYKHGAASHFELLDAQRSVFAAQQAALAVRLALLQNQVALYKALGGGLQDDASNR
jgi:multidrug efflux system outer membrane protein